MATGGGIVWLRSIPAWAGEPWAFTTVKTAASVYPRVGGEPGGGGWRVETERVYPRVGGGTSHQKTRREPENGLSPRGRGNLFPHHPHPTSGRSIPAWAGEPLEYVVLHSGHPVYPRVGGGTPLMLKNAAVSTGLSPRGRGNPGMFPLAAVSQRSIPAWAGEPRRCSSKPCRLTVYPRVGGGTEDVPRLADRLMGLSPRGRGNLPLF